jgi:thioredoxin reductase (NADPH)
LSHADTPSPPPAARDCPNAPRVIVVGAGPIGLETTAALAIAGVDVRCLDAGPIGSTIYALFPPATRFFSSPERLSIAGIDLPVPAQEKVTREAYLAYLRSVVTTLDLPVVTYQEVIDASRTDSLWQLTTRNRAGATTLHAATDVVLAIGGTQHPRRLGVPGESLPQVDHDLGDPHRFFGRRVVIVGGKNSGAEAALRCWRAGAHVTLVHRGKGLHERVKYWIRPELESLIEEGRIQALFDARVIEITIDQVVVHRHGHDHAIPTQDVLLMIGYQQDPFLLDLFGVQCSGEQAAPQFDPITMRTTAPHVYVAGTATAGTQSRFKTYIENSHAHAGRIAAAVLGLAPPPELPARILPEA